MQWHLTDKTLTFVYYTEKLPLISFLSSSHDLHLILIQLLDYLTKTPLDANLIYKSCLKRLADM